MSDYNEAEGNTQNLANDEDMGYKETNGSYIIDKATINKILSITKGEE